MLRDFETRFSSTRTRFVNALFSLAESNNSRVPFGHFLRLLATRNFVTDSKRPLYFFWNRIFFFFFLQKCPSRFYRLDVSARLSDAHNNNIARRRCFFRSWLEEDPVDRIVAIVHYDRIQLSCCPAIRADYDRMPEFGFSRATRPVVSATTCIREQSRRRLVIIGNKGTVSSDDDFTYTFARAIRPLDRFRTYFVKYYYYYYFDSGCFLAKYSPLRNAVFA